MMIYNSSMRVFYSHLNFIVHPWHTWRLLRLLFVCVWSFLSATLQKEWNKQPRLKYVCICICPCAVAECLSLHRVIYISVIWVRKKKPLHCPMPEIMANEMPDYFYFFHFISSTSTWRRRFTHHFTHTLQTNSLKEYQIAVVRRWTIRCHHQTIFVVT